MRIGVNFSVNVIPTTHVTIDTTDLGGGVYMVEAHGWTTGEPEPLDLYATYFIRRGSNIMAAFIDRDLLMLTEDAGVAYAAVDSVKRGVWL